MRNLTKNMPSVMDNDPEYRKLEYVRYADDFMLSFSGPKREAEEIKREIRDFLKRELNLELSEKKTLITHAKKEKARFLGYEIKVTQTNERRMANGKFWYGIPKEAITKAERKYCKKGKTKARAEYLSESDYQIVVNFQSEYRGLVQYYIMAHNIGKLDKVKAVARSSLLKTLAGKHRTSTTKIAKKYNETKVEKGKVYKVLQVTVRRKGKKPLTAHFGAIPLTREPRPINITESSNQPIRNVKSEIVKRLTTERCEMCEKNEPVEAHHIHALKDVNKPGRKKKPAWKYRMSAMKRKTMMVCKTCHRAIHKGQHRREWDAFKNNTPESRVR
jgi:hypothetical protein